MGEDQKKGEPSTHCSGCEHHVKDEVGLWMCGKWGACRHPCEDFKKDEKSEKED